MLLFRRTVSMVYPVFTSLPVTVLIPTLDQLNYALNNRVILCNCPLAKCFCKLLHNHSRFSCDGTRKFLDHRRCSRSSVVFVISVFPSIPNFGDNKRSFQTSENTNQDRQGLSENKEIPPDRGVFRRMKTLTK